MRSNGHTVSFMTRRQGIGLILGALAVIALVFWQVSNVIRINTLLVTIEQKQRTLDSLQWRARQEQIAIARLESAERICRLARERFGLRESEQPPIIVSAQEP